MTIVFSCSHGCFFTAVLSVFPLVVFNIMSVCCSFLTTRLQHSSPFLEARPAYLRRLSPNVCGTFFPFSCWQLAWPAFKFSPCATLADSAVPEKWRGIQNNLSNLCLHGVVFSVCIYRCFCDSPLFLHHKMCP